MDSVFIRDLRVETVVGIYDWERRIRQIVSLDLDMSTDIRRAAGSDRIEDTLDYKAVAKRVAQFVSAAQFQLVETLAEKVAALVLDEFKVTQVKVTLHKPGAVSGSKSVGDNKFCIRKRPYAAGILADPAIRWSGDRTAGLGMGEPSQSRRELRNTYD